MARPENSLLRPVPRVRSPQSEHGLLLLIDPQENDVPCRITVGEWQPNDLPIEALGGPGVGDRDVGFVQVHGCLLWVLNNLGVAAVTLTESAGAVRVTPPRASGR